MLPPIPSSPPGVVVKDDTSSATTKYPVFASVINGQVVFEGVSSTKLYFVPSTGVLTSTSFAGAGTGLTGTAASLSIGGNAATSTLATAATNLAGGLANQLPVQTASGVTSFIGAPSTSGSFLQWTTGGGFAWTSFNGVTSFSAGSTGFTPSTSTTGAITLAGTLNAANGGTGASGLTGYVYGNGTGTMTASTTIPNTAITGLGTMSTQNANAVAITGGSINGTTIGASVAAAANVTTLGVSQYAAFAAIAAPSYAAGVLFYESANDSLTFFNGASGNDLHLGQEIQIRVYNQTGSTIAAGMAVYINGQHSQFPTVDLAQANTLVASNAVGLTNTSIANNSYGYIVTIGKFTGIDTHLFTSGDVLYVSPTTAGALTNVIPTSPNYAVKLGQCIYSNPSQGVVYVSDGPAYVLPAQIIGQVAIANGGTNGTAFPTAGAIAYGTGTAYGFNSAGTTGQVLTSSGAGVPTWTSQSALSVGSATTATSATSATTATNLAGGLAGYLPYQSSAGTTAFLSPGTNGYVLTLAGGVPTWAAASSGSGTVTSVSGTGTVSGLTLTGTVTTSGSLTLGGTLNLSSPPAIGGTSAASGSFTTLSASSIVSLGGDFSGQGSAGYVQLRAGASDTNTMIIRGSSAGARFEFDINGVEKMRFDSNLLIGTTTNTNSSKVVSSGVVESTTGGFRFPDGTTQITAAGGVSSVNGKTGIVQSVVIAGTAVASTSGTSIDFTSIPSWVKRITVMFSAVSTTGTSGLRLQLGNGSIVTTGYNTTASVVGNSATTGTLVSTSGIDTYFITASTSLFGSIVFTNISSNSWVAQLVLGSTTESRVFTSTSQVALSGTLDRVRVTSVNGTDTFDAGSINILYE